MATYARADLEGQAQGAPGQRVMVPARGVGPGFCSQLRYSRVARSASRTSVGQVDCQVFFGQCLFCVSGCLR